LVPLLKEPKTRNKIVEKAKEIKKHQAYRARVGELPWEGKRVVKALLDAAKEEKQVVGPLATYDSHSGQHILVVAKKGKNHVQMNIPLGTNATADELIKAFSQAITEHVIET
jgi:hypothetical protein